jgi:hypothetical protein
LRASSIARCLRRRAGHDRPLTLGQLVPGHEIDRDVIGQHANLADWQQKLNEINAAYPEVSITAPLLP